MGDVTEYPSGAFCWIDLATPDVAGAKAFYGDLLGWEFEDVPMGQGGSYALCRLRGKDVAAIHEDADAHGWDSFISVDDVEEAADRAADLGATVTTEPFDVGDDGRMAVLRDAVGAAVSLWQPGERMGAAFVNDVGAWSWNELATPDVDGAIAFYGDLFGWSAQELPVDLRRASFSMGDLLIGGVHEPTPAEGDSSKWTISFTVPDADQAAARVEQLGGRVLLPPMDIPAGRFTFVAGPDGATMTLAAVPGGPVRGVDGT